MKISLVGEPTNFYVVALDSKDLSKKGQWSGWVKGSARLFYKLQRANKKEFEVMALKLCVYPYIA